MRVDASFPGGRIDVVADDDPGDVRLSVPHDNAEPRYRQWFCFDVHESEGEPVSMAIVNASECTWPRGFRNYRAMATDDGERWVRLPTELEGGALRFSHVPTSPWTRVAYFTPFDAERVDALCARAEQAGARVTPVAESAEGVVMPRLTFGAGGSARRRVWVIAQQHPGEPQGGWFAEGLTARLLAGDPVARRLLEQAVVHVVPRMNPDGCALGNHRTNARGLDLNRQWLEPSDEAPEVGGVRAAIEDEGCDVFLDLHGDETIPHVFAQKTEGVPRRSMRAIRLESVFFSTMMKAAAPDFQTTHGYPRDRLGDANLRIAANWAAARFDCLALTLEMPYTDHQEAADAARGWTAERSQRLGGAAIDALAACLGEIG